MRTLLQSDPQLLQTPERDLRAVLRSLVEEVGVGEALDEAAQRDRAFDAGERRAEAVQCWG